MPLHLLVDPGVALPTRLRTAIRRHVSRMVRAAALRDGRDDYDVALRLCSDDAIRELNRMWRAKDKATDVLAFPQRGSPFELPLVLGDIAISVDTARRQARHGLAGELFHLASHGLCHLLGYDHRNDAEEATMNARAAALRREAKRAGRIRAA